MKLLSPKLPFRLPLAVAAALLSTLATAQQPQLRPPATPLITHNPYFSIWSDTDKLTDSPTRHWTGTPQPIAGLLRVDGHTFRFMGRDPRDTPAMQQTSLTVTPTHTRYTFTAAGVELSLEFFTPAFLNDLDVLSRPVTYLTFTAHATDAVAHDVSLLLDVDPLIAVNEASQEVTFSRNQTATEHVLSVGSRDQRVLNRSGDNLRIDWGYFHLVLPDGEQATSAIAPDAQQTFAATGHLPASDDMDGPEPANRRAAHLAAELPFGQVTTTPATRHLLVAYTQGYQMQYLHRNLRPWWQRNNKPVAQMLEEAERDYQMLESRGTQFDHDLTTDLTQLAGEHYAWICALAYRQSIAAHALVADVDGQPMLFEKENFSNGDTATVDVVYPTSPIFLLFNPHLLEAELRPIFEYTALPNRWRLPFAPHDLGQFPLANGQEYGGGEVNVEDQMPVEESGNLILLSDALSRALGNTDQAEKYWPQLTQWAGFLRDHGLDPENQLTTDDFAGHVTHNANLALKAIDALEAYADLARLLHKDAVAREYSKTAHDYAAKWIAMDKEGDHYKLAYNSPNTWSQKYNLIWDKVLDYNLFPKSLRDSEIAFYQTKLNQYGIPLDSRADYTKLDWEIWTATLADDPAAFNALVDPIFKWTNETPSRVPMTDWYDTKNGKQIGFQARSVVGGVYMKVLSNKQMTARWRALVPKP